MNLHLPLCAAFQIINGRMEKVLLLLLQNEIHIHSCCVYVSNDVHACVWSYFVNSRRFASGRKKQSQNCQEANKDIKNKKSFHICCESTNFFYCIDGTKY